jgi:uncharacterized membrane protein (DUF485 family)
VPELKTLLIGRDARAPRVVEDRIGEAVMEESSQSRVGETASFKELVSRKRTFVVSSIAFVFLFFFPLPILTAFTTVLNGKVIGEISWAYLYGFAQFLVAWVVAFLYWRKAKRFDELARKAIEESSSERRATTL